MSADPQPHIDEWVVDQDVKESLTCAICHDILYQPVNLSTCPHTFCLDCLRTFTQRSQPRCPQCVTAFSANIRSLLSTDDCINGFCNEQLRKVKVRCPDCREWTSTLGVNRVNVIAHQEQCTHVVLRCSVGCGESMPRSRLAAHERGECPQRQVRCERCHESLPLQDIGKHHINERECKFSHLCAQGCGELVPDVCLQFHGADCSHRSVSCPTCKATLQHHQLETHLRENVVDHFTIVADDNSSLRKQVSTMQAELATLHQQVSDLLLNIQLLRPGNTSSVGSQDVASTLQLIEECAQRPTDAALQKIPILMRMHSSSTAVQLAACSLLRFGKANRFTSADTQRFEAAGGAEAIVMVVKEHGNDEALQVEAFEALTNISRNRDTKKRLVLAGGMELVLETMRRHQAAPALQIAGAGALLQLAGAGYRCRAPQFVNECVLGALSVIEQQPGAPSEDHYQASCAIVSSDNSTRRAEVFKAFIDGLFMLLRQCDDDIDGKSTVDVACLALERYLVGTADARKHAAYIIELGGIGCLIRLRGNKVPNNDDRGQMATPMGVLYHLARLGWRNEMIGNDTFICSILQAVKAERERFAHYGVTLALRDGAALLLLVLLADDDVWAQLELQGVLKEVMKEVRLSRELQLQAAGGVLRR